jgi:hypothetical protein
MTSVDDAIFLMDDEVIDNISTKIKTTKKKKPKNSKIDKESISVIAKSLPIDIIKPIIRYSGVPEVSPPEGDLHLALHGNSTIIVPATL